jgi:hypothetical protein
MSVFFYLWSCLLSLFPALSAFVCIIVQNSPPPRLPLPLSKGWQDVVSLNGPSGILYLLYFVSIGRSVPGMMCPFDNASLTNGSSAVMCSYRTAPPLPPTPWTLWKDSVLNERLNNNDNVMSAVNWRSTPPPPPHTSYVTRVPPHPKYTTLRPPTTILPHFPSSLFFSSLTLSQSYGPWKFAYYILHITHCILHVTYYTRGSSCT